ncbi:MAG: hypothetical protein IJQ32_03660 [Paludibacteraceae bacterium]|nr:hypothetical protein [Paludibacteraceae bacterium]
MKTLRYIWMVAMLIVLCGGVQAVTFGKSYKPQYHRYASIQAQAHATMPVLGMGSVSSATMYSGSSLPLAAATGVTTSDDYRPAQVPSGPRRVGENEGLEDEGDDTELPTEPAPLGDALLPMMLMAILFAAFITLRRKRSERVNG